MACEIIDTPWLGVIADRHVKSSLFLSGAASLPSYILQAPGMVTPLTEIVVIRLSQHAQTTGSVKHCTA